MAEWKVSIEKLELFPHPGADALEIGKVGTNQVVIQKGLYSNGDIVGFAPEKAVLPNDFKEPWEKYLKGSNHDRVGSIRLRNEWSCGILIPIEKIVDKVGRMPEIGEDVSEAMGIFKYEPPIPVSLMGQVQKFPENIRNDIAGSHDCEHFRTYASEFVPGERVVVGEKAHGSQFVCTSDSLGSTVTITSKGLRKDDLCLQEDENNSYWKAYHNSNVKQVIEDVVSGWNPREVVRIFGEVIPCQKGYSYGQTKPVVKLFDIRVDGISIPYDKFPESAKVLLVPILYDGEYDEQTVLSYCHGSEQVSGKELHIREGCVIAPYIDRRAKDFSRLRLKILNPKYKQSGEEFN